MKRVLSFALTIVITLALAACSTGSTASNSGTTGASSTTAVSASISSESTIVQPVPSVSEEALPGDINEPEKEGRNIVMIFSNSSVEKVMISLMNPRDNEQINLEPAIAPGESIKYELENWPYTDDVLLFAVYDSTGECVQINQIDMTSIEQGIMVTLLGETKYDNFSIYCE